MASLVIDVFMLYQFLKRLATPFEKWDAFKLGIIDKDGNVIKKSNRSVDERAAWSHFDILVANLKKLLAKVPGGSSIIASYAAALILLKEDHSLPFNVIEEKFNMYLTTIQEEITNNVGNGNIAGVGVGVNGEPGFKEKQIHKYKRKQLRDIVSKTK